jgi:hypothetical protein
MGLGDQDTAAVFEVLKRTIFRAPKGKLATVDRNAAGGSTSPDGE